MAQRRPLWHHLGVWTLAVVVGSIVVQSSVGPSNRNSPAETPPRTESSTSPQTSPTPEEGGPEQPSLADSTQSTPNPTTPHSAPESAPDSNASTQNEETSETDPLVDTALGMLEEIEVKGKAPRTGFDREGQFGPAWKDTDGNGCDTRNDILARDLDDVVREGSCRVLSGELIDPFSARAVSFLRGETTSRDVQIDHVVSLSNAWQTGAQSLSATTRELLANDPLNLIAVSGSLNAQKGDADAATWLPPNRAFRCEYVARQIGVKYHYGLWVTSSERDQMRRVLEACPSYPALTPAEHGDYRPGTIPPS